MSKLQIAKEKSVYIFFTYSQFQLANAKCFIRFVDIYSLSGKKKKTFILDIVARTEVIFKLSLTIDFFRRKILYFVFLNAFQA